MKIAFYADAHCRDNGSYPRFNIIDSNGLSKELNNIIRGHAFVADIIKDECPQVVFNLGDQFHDNEYISSRTLHGTDIALRLIKDACAEVSAKHILVDGNHDIYNEVLQIKSTNILRFYFDKILEAQSEIIDINGIQIGMFGYTSSHRTLYNGLMELIPNVNFIVTHNEFAGSYYDNLFCVTEGVSPDLKIPIFSGHMHPAHTVGSVNYVGSLVQNRFSLNNNNFIGGVLIFDTDTGEIKRFKNTYSKHYIKALSSDEILKYDKDKYIFQLKTFESRESLEDKLAGYDYFYIRAIDNSPDIKITYTEVKIEKPEDMLRNYIQDNNPDALETFEQVLGG